MVVPALDEAHRLPEVHRRITAALEGRPWQLELVIVDDGSRDDSWEVIRSLAAADPAVRGVRLASNSGHPAAVAAGFGAATGEIVAMIDADLETDPESLPLLIEAVEAGADLASGYRTTPRRWTRELPSRIFNRHASRCGVPLRDVGCGTNAVRHWIAREYATLGNLRRSLVKPVLYSMARRTVEVPVASERPDGSHLGFGDLVTLWIEFDALHKRPQWLGLLWVALAGGLAAAATAVAGLLRWSEGGPVLLALAAAVALLAVLVAVASLVAGQLVGGLTGLTLPRFRVADTCGAMAPEPLARISITDPLPAPARPAAPERTTVEPQ